MINLMFSAVLGFGLLRGRSYLKLLFEEGFQLRDEGWMIMTRRWAFFFFAMAVLNEIIWRTQSTEIWVDVKTFGYLPLTLIFTLAQAPLMKKYAIHKS